MKSKFLLFLIVLCILFGMACVSAGENHTISQSPDYHTFAELNQTISKNESEVNLEHDYRYEGGEVNVSVSKTGKFTINGNGHVLDGVRDYNALSFNSTGEVIVRNLTFRNFTNTSIVVESPVIFENVTFIDCAGSDLDDFISAESKLHFSNCVFQNNNALLDFIRCERQELVFKNTVFKGGNFEICIIYANRCDMLVENCTFENVSSSSGAFLYKGANLTVKRSKFININSRLSGGAIWGKFFPKGGSNASSPFLIENCEFSNLKAGNDGGAVYLDMDSGSEFHVQTLSIVNSSFANCKSRYGGGICNLGGVMNVVNTTFLNTSAGFEGGAIYTSWCRLNISNSTISNASAQKNAGAIYFDRGRMTLEKSNILGSKVTAESESTGRAIYAYDAVLDFSQSTFDNGGISVYAVFTDVSRMDVHKNNDTFSLGNENYIVSVEGDGIHIDFINSTITVDKLPSRFNSTQWNWTTPDKYQGDNDDCWAFATVASMETALLKSTGISYNLSQNYVQKLQLKYFINGDLRISLTGFDYSGLGHALSWLGTVPMDSEYDAVGIVADVDLSDSRIHLQDARIIFIDANNTMDILKRAILKYGAVSVHKILAKSDFPLNTTGENISVMEHYIHFVSLIGWQDGENGTGYWIAKDSTRGAFEKIEYNDTSFMAGDRFSIVPQNVAIAYIFENNIDYHVNYQSDLTALTGFDGNYTYYSNEFTSKYSELIGAVGTYFNESGISYSFDVYVNGQKILSQSGVSEFAGFRTIVLDRYVPVRQGDRFKVVFKNNSLPYQAYSRQHYMAEMSFISNDGKSWSDITLQNRTVCLKVYTVADDAVITGNDNITVDYAGGSRFSVRLKTADGHDVGAGANVTFTINGRSSVVATGSDGIAGIEITEAPGTYTITAAYGNVSLSNTVTVGHVIKAGKAAVKKSSKKFALKAKLKINGKAVKGKKITFKLNGKKYAAKTDKKGIAKVTFKKNVIKKLKKGKTYRVKVAYLKDKVKTTVRVK